MSKCLAKFSKLVDWKVFGISSVFAAFIFIFEIYFFKTDYIFYNFEFLTTGNWRFITFCVFYQLFALFIFVWLIYVSLLSSRRFRIVYLVFFTIAVLHEYSYYKCYSRFSDLTDFYIAYASTWTQTFNAIFSYWSWLSLVPVIIYTIFLLIIKNKECLFGYKTFFLILVIFVGFYTSVFYFKPKFFVPIDFPSVAVANFSRSVVGYYSSVLLENGRKRNPIELPSKYELPQNNIVLVIDESVRGDHLSLNGYQRSTTPYLEKLAKENLLKTWGVAVSGSTCSISSYNLLITGILVNQLPDIERKRWNLPSIFQYAKAMNYKTHFFDGQRSFFWGGTPDDLNYIDLWEGVNSFQYDYDTDFRIAKKTNGILSKSQGNFIVIFKRGLHTPFNTNYPTEKEIWKPGISDSDFPTSPELQSAFVNAFDNSLAYNLDNFFKTLYTGINQNDDKNITLYTSDHAQTLGENGARYSHCQDSPNEVKVPLLLLGYSKTLDTKFRATHANILPTLLDLINYPESLRSVDYSKSLLKTIETDNSERYYFSPNLQYGKRFKFD